MREVEINGLLRHSRLTSHDHNRCQFTKIGILARDYPPLVGGVATYTYELSNRLSLRGHQVRVLAGYTDERTVLLPFVHDLRKYDLINVQEPFFGPFIPKDVPSVVTVHATSNVLRSHLKLSKKIKSGVARLFENVCLAKADQIIAASRLTYDDLVQNYGVDEDRLHFIPLAVDCDLFRPSNKEENRVTRILLAQRLEPVKDISRVFRMVAKLPRERYAVDVVGEGSLSGRLRRLASELGVNVIFHGSVADRTQLASLYGAADIFVFATTLPKETILESGISLSTLEAMASGCTVIICDEGPIGAEMHRSERELGVLFCAYEDLTDVLSRLAEDRDERVSLGKNARAAALKHSWRQLLERTLEVYDKALGLSVSGG